ncbi:MAG TPA: PDZ domain-containing protein [Burkholderiales bacterium]
MKPSASLLRMGLLLGLPLALLLGCDGRQQPPRPKTAELAQLDAQPVGDQIRDTDLSHLLGVAVRNGIGGVMIVGMDLDGPAATAGALVGDFITAVNGASVSTEQELAGRLSAAAGTGRVRLQLWRQGEPREAAITVQQALDDSATGSLGLHVRELPEATLKSLGVAYGVMVTKVRGIATRSRLLPGDVIVAVNQTKIRSLDEFNRLLGAAQSGMVSLLVRRADADLYIPLDLRAGRPTGATNTPLRT